MQARYPFGGRGHTGEILSDPTVVETAETHDRTAAQVILHRNLQRGVVAIPGSSDPDHIRKNISVFDFSLTDEEMERIAALYRGTKFDLVLRVRKGPATKSDRRRREGDEICSHTDGQTHIRRFLPRAKIFDNRPPKLYNNFRRSNVCGRPRGEIRRQLHNRERHNRRQATAPGTKIKYRAVGQPPRLPPDRKPTRQKQPAGKVNTDGNPTRNTQYKIPRCAYMQPRRQSKCRA